MGASPINQDVDCRTIHNILRGRATRLLRTSWKVSVLPQQQPCHIFSLMTNGKLVALWRTSGLHLPYYSSGSRTRGSLNCAKQNRCTGVVLLSGRLAGATAHLSCRRYITHTSIVHIRPKDRQQTTACL